MGKRTGITWCDHTFNPWIGCKKVSEGCEHCYAERDNARFGWVETWGEGYKHTGASYWAQPLSWARSAKADGENRRVFCASLADVLDEGAPALWRRELWELILQTAEIGGLEWALLTKRPQNVALIPAEIAALACVRLGVTVEDQHQVKARLPMLLEAWKGKNFVSVEPMLSRVIFPVELMRQLDWVICGCETGPGRRPMRDEWWGELNKACRAAGVPFLLKQVMVDGHLDADWPYYVGLQQFP